MTSQLAGVKLTRADATALFTPGQIFTDADGKVYKYLLFNNGAGSVASVVGNVAYYYGVSGAGALVNINTCTMDVTDSIGIGAGVFQAVLADGEYGWLQVRGVATLTTALTAGAEGNALTPIGTTDGTLDVSALVTDNICAYAMDISAKIVMCNFPI